MSAHETSYLIRILHWRYLGIVNVIVIGLILWSLSKEHLRTQSIDAQIALLQTQVDSLHERNVGLQSWQTALQTESFLEREARLKLGYKKEGERVIIIQDTDTSTMASTAIDPTDPFNYVIDSTDTIETEVSNPVKWWRYFFYEVREKNL